MVRSRHSVWEVRDHSWSPSTLREVAEQQGKGGDAGAVPLKPQVGVQGRWRQPAGRVTPEVSLEAAQRRVAHLEGALLAFEDATGPEVTMLQESLKQAKRVAQVPPVQLSQCEQFVSRAEKRLSFHDEARAQLVQELEDGQKLLQKLREDVSQSQPRPQPPADWGAQLTRLQQMVKNFAVGARCLGGTDAVVHFMFSTSCGLNRARVNGGSDAVTGASYAESRESSSHAELAGRRRQSLRPSRQATSMWARHPITGTKTLRVVVRETTRAPGCPRVWRYRPNRGVDTFVECRSKEVASDLKWDGSMTVHIWCRTVTLWGWRGERVGEAKKHGPPQSKSTVMGRTRSQTARMLATQVEVDDQSRSRSPVKIPPTCVDVSSSPMSRLLDGLEEDLGQEFVSPSVAVVPVSPNNTTDNGLVAHQVNPAPQMFVMRDSDTDSTLSLDSQVSVDDLEGRRSVRMGKNPRSCQWW